MGFMDKAKKLAEQAQQKLDDAQKNFRQGGSTPGQADPGAGARYDQHGRPVAGAGAQDAPPAGTTPPPSGEPPSPAGEDAPAAEPEPAPEPSGAPTPPSAPAADAPAPDPDAPAPSQGGSPNSTPDPFKPLQQ